MMAPLLSGLIPEIRTIEDWEPNRRSDARMPEVFDSLHGPWRNKKILALMLHLSFLY